ncbi:MAG: TonB family protein [Acidiphilium sp.]
MAELSFDTMAGPGESRFGWALLAALIIEVVAIVALMFAPSPPRPLVVKPVTMAVHLVKPVGPPKAIPLPPKPVQPPKPKPPKPLPVLPKPPPPLPNHPHIHVLRKPPPKPVHRIVPRRIARPMPPQPAPPPQLAPPASQTTAPPPSLAQLKSAEARYVGIMRGVILSHLVVPAALRNLGVSGVAMVAFKVTPNGQILWIRVIKQSAYQAANRAARTAVQDSHFPAFLAEMPHHAIIFEIPVHVSGAG